MSGVDPAMFELFREEVRAHSAALGAGLLELESDPANPRRIEPLMRAAHSIKGAARIVSVEPGVRLAHVVEDALVAAQAGKFHITPPHIDTLLKASDILAELASLQPNTVTEWTEKAAPRVAQLHPIIAAMVNGNAPPLTTAPPPLPIAVVAPQPTAFELPSPPPHEVTAISEELISLTGEHSMHDLFREELRTALLVLHGACDLLDSGNELPGEVLDATKQLRGAARLMKYEPVADVAGVLGDVFDSLRGGQIAASRTNTEWLRHSISILANGVNTNEESFPAWLDTIREPLTHIADTFRKVPTSVPTSPPPPPTPPPTSPATPAPPAEPVVRVTAKSLSRLMGLAGESLVQARWLQLFSSSLMKQKKQHDILAGLLDAAYHAAASGSEDVAQAITSARTQAGVCRKELADKTSDFDEHAARAEDLNTRLYREVIVSRMRPFGDGVHGFSRLVRDMSRSLGKQARLVIDGETTEVDRDVLEKLEAPLSHLIRNAVDHGIEPIAARTATGKPEVATIRVEAHHRAGMLSVSVSDDGGGIDVEKLRRKIIERGLNSPDLVRQMTEAEVLEFLFLPGFSTAENVTEYSGRGVGLDVVQETARAVGGSIRISTNRGTGTMFHLQLPITLSVMRAVVVNISGEPYAFPHNRIDRLLRVPQSEVQSLEHRQFVSVDGHNVGLVVSSQILELPATPPNADLPIVLLRDATGAYGLLVDSFRGEQDLVVRPLDPRLGKVPNMSAAAILDDGSPVLIVDVEDMLRAMDQFIQTGTLQRCEPRRAGVTRKKRVLIADDSITVREVERQLLRHKGYDVAVAVDGMDAWNQIRAGDFDLLVSDVDMPRMTGLQLVQAVRAEERLKDLPVVIVSYKEREEDRLRGLDVGANHYLTKSAFHDNRFVQTVEDLIGPA